MSYKVTDNRVSGEPFCARRKDYLHRYVLNTSELPPPIDGHWSSQAIQLVYMWKLKLTNFEGAWSVGSLDNSPFWQRNEPGWKLIKALTNDNKNVCFFIVINSNADCLSNFRLFSTSNCRSEIRTNIFLFRWWFFVLLELFHCSSTFIRKLKTFFHCIVVFRTLEFGYISQWCSFQMWNFQRVPRTAQSIAPPAVAVGLI